MKIAVTYEKKDILKLIERDLVSQGIRVKAGTSLVYKGALEVRLSVETEDDLVARTEPAPTRDVVTQESPPAPPADPDMSTILAASRRLVKNEQGLARTLGPGESLEFPTGDQ